MIILLKINQNEVWTKILGEFNAYNLLAVYAAAKLLDEEEWNCLKSISQLKNVHIKNIVVDVAYKRPDYKNL